AYHLRPGLGPKAGWTTQEGFSYYDRSSAFAVRALKTYVPFRMDEWKFNARFIDVSMAKELHEDYHPAHTFDRRQDLEYRREAFEYYRENFDVVIGTEHGNDWGVDLVDYTEGAAGGPFHWEKQGAWHSGYYTRPTSREDYSKKYLKYGVGYETSIPLWQLVYHDCVSGSYYWGDCAGFHYHVAPEIADRKDLFNLLYGTVPLFWRSNRAFDWPTNKDRFMESYHNTCHFHEAIAFDSLVDHRFLNEEGTLQETRFSSGGFAAINFGEEPISYESPDGEKLILAPRGFFAKADGFYQSRLWKEGMPQTRIEKEGFVRYQSPERTEIGGVDFQGTYTAFKVTDSRWQFALEDDTEYRIDLARLTGWEKDSKLTLLLLDDLGKTTQFSSPNIHDGDLIIRTREGEDCFALVRGEIPTELVIYPKKEIVQPHEKIVLSFSDPKARLHYTLDGSEPTVESPLFEDPFSLADSARVQVRPFKEGAPLIETASKDYRVAHTLLKTPVIHGSESAHFIETSVEGYDQLRLLVTDGGDDCWSDKASFGDPILIKRDGTEISLSDLSPNYYFLLYGHLTADKRENDENISIAGKKFEKGIGVSSTAEVIFDLGKEYKTFKSYVGIDDYNSTTPENPLGSVEFIIQGIKGLD
ncbi:MAG: NPCBM/NEW2 domain-containing protein, partial [Candidatus Omnitrophica bacterium]|nr:NPCBM/NEW2 domain-containing protein [Candidatus Omnitrophota bacterium]